MLAIPGICKRLFHKPYGFPKDGYWKISDQVVTFLPVLDLLESWSLMQVQIKETITNNSLHFTNINYTSQCNMIYENIG